MLGSEGGRGSNMASQSQQGYYTTPVLELEVQHSPVASLTASTTALNSSANSLVPASPLSPARASAYA